MSSRLVLDAWALLAWVGGEEPAAGVVQALLEQAEGGSVELLVSTVNLGEVFYRVARAHGVGTAREVRAHLGAAPIRPVSADDDLVWAAAELKAVFPISYADAFAAALAERAAAAVVTGDPDFGAPEAAGRVPVRWLHRDQAGRG